jgi:hypothetical protein
VPPHGKKFPRLTAEKASDHLEKLFWVEYEYVAEILFIHDEIDNLIRVLLPLRISEVAIRELFAF